MSIPPTVTALFNVKLQLVQFELNIAVSPGPGTAAVDQLPAVFQLLSPAVPVQVYAARFKTVAVALAALTVLRLVPSSAVPALMVIPTVPSPVQLDRVTVGVLVVPLLTTGVLQVTPEGLTVTPAGRRLKLVAPE